MAQNKNSGKKNKAEERKKLIIRIVCIVMCAALIGTLGFLAACSGM